MRKIDVRIMITIECPLPELEAEGKISSDLYFLLSGLELFIPPLRERKEDLKRKLDMTLQSCCERYGTVSCSDGRSQGGDDGISMERKSVSGGELL